MHLAAARQQGADPGDAHAAAHIAHQAQGAGGGADLIAAQRRGAQDIDGNEEEAHRRPGENLRPKDRPCVDGEVDLREAE